MSHVRCGAESASKRPCLRLMQCVVKRLSGEFRVCHLPTLAHTANTRAILAKGSGDDTLASTRGGEDAT